MHILRITLISSAIVLAAACGSSS
ncbi:MAG: hypothetical protein QOF59_1425, partial [Actinomycetota bacterium]|nr:hypothetical protein [Actinomycetota bacterium]